MDHSTYYLSSHLAILNVSEAIVNINVMIIVLIAFRISIQLKSCAGGGRSMHVGPGDEQIPYLPYLPLLSSMYLPIHALASTGIVELTRQTGKASANVVCQSHVTDYLRNLV
jgi:hypothetical protein